ncbi:response regulator [Jiella sp. M17.18]|uniref:response regulator n=1 Tax=Jiella sp. M17.18 TaxID=3234247 RepID=UPI0034DDF7D4
MSLIGHVVLVVEDEYYLADDVAVALNRLGATVIGPVPTVAEARERLARADRIDLAVLDINLQGEAIYPFADDLSDRGIRFVFATGYDTAVLPERFRDTPRWQKPFDPQGLAAALAEPPR